MGKSQDAPKKQTAQPNESQPNKSKQSTSKPKKDPQPKVQKKVGPPKSASATTVQGHKPQPKVRSPQGPSATESLHSRQNNSQLPVPVESFDASYSMPGKLLSPGSTPSRIDPAKIEIIDAPTGDSDAQAPIGVPDEVAYDPAADAEFDAEAAFLRKVEDEERERGSRSSEPTFKTPSTLRDQNNNAEESSALVPSRDPVTAYLTEIRRYPLLTREQERELAVRFRETGDPKAAEILVTSNLRFVVKVAAEYSRFGAKLIDLIQEGNVGLMHAVREFNPYKEVRLITYAVWWIRGYIQEYLMRQYSLVRIGTTQNQRKLFYRLQKERESLDAAGQEPNYALLAGRLGVSEEEVETMSKRLSGRDISLNQPIDGDQSAASLLDFEASNEEAVDDRIGRAEEIEVLRENIEKIKPGLSQKELYILNERTLADDPLTLQEIGDHYGITREAVRQIEARLLAKIRSAMNESLTASSSKTAPPSPSTKNSIED